MREIIGSEIKIFAPPEPAPDMIDDASDALDFVRLEPSMLIRLTPNDTIYGKRPYS
jgi:hypothetical protein